MKRGGAYDSSIRVFAVTYAVIGLVMLVVSIARGGGPLSIGFLLGIAFIALGVGRYVIQRKVTREDSE